VGEELSTQISDAIRIENLGRKPQTVEALRKARRR